MGRTIHISSKVFLRVPPEELWAFLADTDRMNQAIDLPTVRFVPRFEHGKSLHYAAEHRLLGIRFEYEEFPFEWVEGSFYRVLRRYRVGPIREVTAGIRMRPEQDGSELEAYVDVEPRGWLGSLLGRTVIPQIKDRILGLVKKLERHLLASTEVPEPALPPRRSVFWSELELRAQRLRGFPLAGRLAAKLERHLKNASGLEVTRIRPFDLADHWGEPRPEVLRLMLYAVRSGLVELVWTVLCPNCAAPTQEASSLWSVKHSNRCDTCSLDFDSDLGSSVEARFRVHPAVRLARRKTYCIGGPANMPHVIAQLRLGPGESRKETAPLKPGPVRVRCFQSEGSFRLKVGGDGALGRRILIQCGPSGLGVEADSLRPGPIEIEAVNRTEGEALIVLERESWRESSVTGTMIAAMQDFWDLFPAEAAESGLEIGAASVALAYCAVAGSDAVYRSGDDSEALRQLTACFKYVSDRASNFQGGLVKTWGDAALLSFASSRDAAEAALEALRGWEEFRRLSRLEPGLSLRFGIHEGPAIAVQRRGGVEFFGGAVREALRAGERSEGRSLVLTEGAYNNPFVRVLLEGRGCRCEPISPEDAGGRAGLRMVRP